MPSVNAPVLRVYGPASFAGQKRRAGRGICVSAQATGTLGDPAQVSTVHFWVSFPLTG